MPKRAKPSEIQQPLPFIIEVEGYDGDDGTIVVQNYRAETESFGVPDKIYCIGKLEPDGVIRFDDWGYATAEEARKALGGRIRVQGLTRM